MDFRKDFQEAVLDCFRNRLADATERRKNGGFWEWATNRSGLDRLTSEDHVRRILGMMGHEMTGFAGTVRNDEIFPDGTAISFEARRLLEFPLEGLREVPDLASFEGICLAVCTPTETTAFVLGSAILIGPGLAITASHVVEGLQEAANWRDGHRHMYCLGVTSSGLIHWTVTRIDMMNGSDLAAISIKLSSSLPPNGKFNVAELSVGPPSVGELVALAGFRPTGPRFENSPAQVTISLNQYVSVGKVSEVQGEERISALVASPCFRAEAPTLRAMSGGPAFDKDGRVLGIISTGEDDGPTIVCMIWPYLHMPLTTHWPKGVAEEPMSLAKRADMGYLTISDRYPSLYSSYRSRGDQEAHSDCIWHGAGNAPSSNSVLWRRSISPQIMPYAVTPLFTPISPQARLF